MHMMRLAVCVCVDRVWVLTCIERGVCCVDVWYIVWWVIRFVLCVVACSSVVCCGLCAVKPCWPGSYSMVQHSRLGARVRWLMLTR